MPTVDKNNCTACNPFQEYEKRGHCVHQWDRKKGRIRGQKEKKKKENRKAYPDLTRSQENGGFSGLRRGEGGGMQKGHGFPRGLSTVQMEFEKKEKKVLHPIVKDERKHLSLGNRGKGKGGPRIHLPGVKKKKKRAENEIREKCQS